MKKHLIRTFVFLSGIALFSSCMKNDPEKSYVTIEIRSDLSLGQVKAKFNREPDLQAKLFVNEWYNKCVAPEKEKLAV